MRSREMHDFAGWMRDLKAGKAVILTDNGAPLAMLEPVRSASKAEVRAIQQMIDSGLLEPGRKTGNIREWKWKRSRTKAAA